MAVLARHLQLEPSSFVSSSPTTHETLYTFKEAMSYLRVSRSTIYRLMGSGQLTGRKVGSTWRFFRADLHACISQKGVSTSLVEVQEESK